MPVMVTAGYMNLFLLGISCYIFELIQWNLNTGSYHI